MKTTLRRPGFSRGMTLLELTVVILVILGLIGVLLVSSRSWKRGSDRSACIMNIRNMQNAVRAYQSIRQLNEGHPLNISVDVIGPGNYIQYVPQCPGGGTYTPITQIPVAGQLVITCSLAGSSADHEPKDYSEW